MTGNCTCHNCHLCTHGFFWINQRSIIIQFTGLILNDWRRLVAIHSYVLSSLHHHPPDLILKTGILPNGCSTTSWMVFSQWCWILCLPLKAVCLNNTLSPTISFTHWTPAVIMSFVPFLLLLNNVICSLICPFHSFLKIFNISNTITL